MAGVIDGLPYPTGTDLVVEGDNAIRALAEAVAKNPAPPMVTPALASGWTVVTYPLEVRAVNGWVYITGRLGRSANLPATTPVTVATLPVGYRPPTYIFGDVFNYLASATPAPGITLALNIEPTTGTISVTPMGASFTTGHILYFSHSFPRAL